ncbi:MAG TPA: lysophospholipid acyltransferase family protein [Gemmataceae bacterium]|nr:lysophospholipid acyltransferase family protein [Gemmataceae bacterium]
MKIRHPLLIKAMGFAIGWLVRLWIGTLRYRYRPMGASLDPNQPHFRGRYLYAFWHENILVPAYHYGRRDIHVLISEHADGQMIAEACRHLGFRVVRGSATRGGARAVRQMVRRSRSAHLAITPDGPRGPRRRVQAGVVYLAALTGLPIVPFGIAFERAWRMSSWDRFAVPWPWSGAVCVTAEPIYVPPDIRKEQLEVYRQRVQEAMDAVSEAAEGIIRGAVDRNQTSGQPLAA